MKYILLIISVFFWSFSSQAGFLLEPHLGYGVSNKYEQGSFNEDFDRTQFGVRLGYQAPMGFLVGGEINLTTNTFEFNGSGPEIKAAGADIGPFIGYQTAMGLRFFGGLLSSALVFDDAFDTTYTGIGVKLGAGFKLTNWLAVNLEYLMNRYSDVDTNTTVSGNVEDLDINSFVISASFPFNIGG